MAIKESKGRLIVSLEKEILEALKEDARKNKRTVSNQLAIILAKHFNIELD